MLYDDIKKFLKKKKKTVSIRELKLSLKVDAKSIKRKLDKLCRGKQVKRTVTKDGHQRFRFIAS